MLATTLAPTTRITAPVGPSRPAREPGTDALADGLDRGSVRILAAKEHLFCEGDNASHVFRVEAGHICIYRTMPDGRRHVIDFAYPGDVIGLGALGEHCANAQATSKTVVRALPVSMLNDLATRDPRLGVRLLEALSRELLAAREQLFTVSQRTAYERLASFLLTLSRRNERRGEDPNEIVLPMTRSDIADFLGLTIETVSRTFTRFRTDRLIDLEHCILVTLLDTERLQDLAEGRGEARE